VKSLEIDRDPLEINMKPLGNTGNPLEISVKPLETDHNPLEKRPWSRVCKRLSSCFRKTD
jgi:hypothetical protein